MAEEHHHHHHHHRDGASLFRDRSLKAIEIRRKLEKWGKRFLLLVAILMILAVCYVYVFG